MPHLAGPKFAVNFRRDSNSERIGNALRNLAHGHAFLAPDVHRQAIQHISRSGEQIRARDILDERKIARANLLAATTDVLDGLPVRSEEHTSELQSQHELV